MRSLFLLSLAITCFGASGLLAHPPQSAPPVRQSVREFQVPQPDKIVAIPQPPRTFREVTETRTYEVTPRAAIHEYVPVPVQYGVPVIREVPVYSVPVVGVPVYAVPVFGKTPVGTTRSGLFGFRQNIHNADGSVDHYGPLGGYRGTSR